eukprot:435997-Alexandrium_andersonii.AAC.1
MRPRNQSMHVHVYIGAHEYDLQTALPVGVLTDSEEQGSGPPLRVHLPPVERIPLAFEQSDPSNETLCEASKF